MSAHQYHRGVAFAVKEMTADLWEWSIFPPDCVKGFAPASGVIAGSRACAVNAAKQEIEAQDIRCMN